MDGTPWWFFCLVLLAGNLPTSSSSHCAPPTNALKHEVDNMTMWTCPMGHAWSDGGAVHISDCDEADEISSDLTCDQQMGVVSLCLSALVQNIEGAKTPVDLGTNSKYLKCEDGKAWLSDRFYHLVHCEDGAWTTVEDICDEACEVPRDCAVLADMGAQTQDSFYIKPNGHPREPSVLVFCQHHNRLGDSGWMTIFTKFTYFEEALDGDTISDIHWNEGGARPFVLLIFILTDMDLYFATYDDVFFEKDPPWTLLEVGTYHGTAGDSLRFNIGGSYHSYGDLGWISNDTRAMHVSQDTIKWPTITEDISRIYFRFRPKEFDRRVSCPPSFGVSPSDSSTTSIYLYSTRREFITYSFSCNGELYMEGSGETQSGKSTSGSTRCTRDANGDLAWSDQLYLPCRLTCPDGYLKTGGNTTCLYFSEDVATMGIAEASLSCARMEASLGDLTTPDDMYSAEVDQKYYTRRLGSVVDSSLNLTCSSNGNCEDAEDLPCTVVTKGANQMDPEMSYQSCDLEDKRYICMRPAECPKNYHTFRGHCYKLIPASTFGGKADFVAALQECQKDLAALAFPESMEDLDFLSSLALLLLGDTKILIGLNDVFGNWTVENLYSPNQDILDILPNSTTNGSYVILKTSNELEFASFLSDEPVDYAACQLYGPIGCWAEPPPPLGNMTLSWDGNNTAVGAMANYTCYLGYFVNATVPNVTQEMTCFGQLGNWVTVDDFVDCEVAPVCHENDLKNIEPNSRLTNDSVKESFYMNGTITFTCPYPMAFYPSLATDMTVNCTYNDSQDAYSFQPSLLESCDVCRLVPLVFNASTSWDEDEVYVIDDKVNVTCTENSVFSLGNDRREILCTEFGWEVAPDCHKACTVDPPEAGSNMTMLNFSSNFIGDEVTYVCEPGFFIPSTFPDLLNETMVECGDDHRWNVTGPELECAIICVDDPVIPPTPATLSWDGQNRTYGTEALLECPDGLRFADESTNMSLTCMENGTWTQPDAELLVCRIRADEPPKNLTDATLNGPDPPYWKDMVLNLTCNDGWLTTSGEKQTTVTFNGSTWLLDDPDFECWKVADDPPEVITNATLGGPDPPYWKTVTLNYTCDDGFLTSLGARQTLVTFNGTAWEMDDPEFACWKVATKPPENITGASLEGPDPPYWKTTTLNYTCFNGYLTADGEDQTSVTFNGTDWVLDDPDFVCLMVCPSPPAPLAYVRRNYTGKGIDGDVATYVCAGAFDNGNDTVDITCTAGNWSMDVLPECGKEGERSSRSFWYFLRIFPSVEYRGSCAFRVHLDIFFY